VELPKAQDFLLRQYRGFFENFKPTEEFQGYQLKILLRIAKKINANMRWLHFVEEPFGIIVEPE